MRPATSTPNAFAAAVSTSRYDPPVDLLHDVVDDVIPTGHQRDVMISRIARRCQEAASS